MALNATCRGLVLLCCVLCVMALGACAGVCPDRAARRGDSPAASSSTAAGLVAATRDVFHRHSTNSTILLLDRHPSPGEWQGPLTMGAAIRIGLAHSQTLQECFAQLGVPPEQRRLRILPQGGSEMADAFSETPLGYSQLAPGWPRAMAEELVRTVLGEEKTAAAASPANRLELTAVAAALDVILDVRERWYTLVAVSQAHVVAMDELLAAEAGWQMRSGTISDEMQRQEALARYEAARRDTARTEMALRAAQLRMQQSLGLPGQEVVLNVPPLLPGRPVTELSLSKGMLEDVEWRSVTASLDLALARSEVAPAAQPEATAETMVANTMRLPAGQSGTADYHWQPRPTHRVPWANWAFPAPFFSPSFTTRTEAQAAREREWRRYQAMTAVVRSATRAAGESLVNSRQKLEHLEQQRGPRRRPQQLVGQAGRADTLQDATAFLDNEREGLTRRKAMIAAHLDYWIARSRLEHLLAGRMALIQSPLAFHQVSIMQPLTE